MPELTPAPEETKCYNGDHGHTYTIANTPPCEMTFWCPVLRMIWHEPYTPPALAAAMPKETPSLSPETLRCGELLDLIEKAINRPALAAAPDPIT